VYKPPSNPFSFQNPANDHNIDTKIIIGDFNFHNTSWSYAETDEGKKLENWTNHSNLKLIHDLKLPASLKTNGIVATIRTIS